jgi:crossover junction endodeoxyribonuclease RusA
VQIILDFPPADLFPNRSKGKHWAVMHKSKATYRESSYWATKQQAGGWKHAGGDLHLTLTFHMPDKRHRDADNCLAAAKAGLDGMADALGVNDSQFQPVVIFREYGKKPGKMIVDIEVA